jgi:hypothetical protein
MIKQGQKVKIKNGENAGRQGVAVAKAPGAGKAPIWMVVVENKGQVRIEEKDIEAV